MKKLLLVLSLVASIFTLTACGAPASETLVKDYMDTMKKGDFSKSVIMSKIVKNAQGTESSDKEKDAQQKFVKLLFTAFDYTVVSTKETGETSTVELKVNAPDIMNILKLYQAKVQEYSKAGKDINNIDNALAALSEVYTAKDLAKVEKAISVKLDKKTGKWAITNEIELLDATSGGYISKMLGNQIPE